MSIVKKRVVDVLIVGDGIAGCMAALAARKRGADVVIIEKVATQRAARQYGFLRWVRLGEFPRSIPKQNISPTS